MTKIEEKTCPICHKPFQEHNLGEKNGYKFLGCHSCGSVITEPKPTQDDLDQFFADIQPEAVHLPNPEKELSRISNLIKKVAGPANKRHFLDISSRHGYAVAAAKQLGFQAIGIDSHEFFVNFAKDKYDMNAFEHITLQDYAEKGVQADIIFSEESLCEQPDLESYMSALHKVLAPKGLIYMKEPHGNHFRLPHVFTSWAFVDPPINFTYLSKVGIEALLDRHGLKIKKSFFCWAPFMRLVIVRK